jgi:hypothetical protein
LGIYEVQLSVIITHHRDVEHLRKCLKALKEEIAGIDSEMIVVLSEYQPDMLDNFRQDFSGVKFLPFEKNLYFVRSVNRGLEQAKGDFIMIINDDVVVSKGPVALMLDFLKNNPAVGLVGPRILYPEGSKQSTCFRFYRPITVVCRRTILGKISFCKKINEEFLYQDKNLNEILEVDWLMNGAGVLTRKECLEKVGLLDERFQHYFSDVDWSRRFWQNGYKVIYFPKTFFFHYHGKKSGKGGIMSLFTNKLARIHLKDGIKYFLKWGFKSDTDTRTTPG